MTLHDPRFIAFDGSPVTGRVPPELRVMNDVPLSREQYGGVAHTYKLFRDALTVQVGDFLVQNRVLPDGTRIRMESKLGRDVVLVWPVGGGDAAVVADLLFGVLHELGATSYDPTGATKYVQKSGFGATPPQSASPDRNLIDGSWTKQYPGNLTWFSEAVKKDGKHVVVSWHGRATRYGKAEFYGARKQLCLAPEMDDAIFRRTSALSSVWGDRAARWLNAYRGTVWVNGVRHQTRANGLLCRVLSAGIRKIDGALHLYVVAPKTVYGEGETIESYPLYDQPVAVFSGSLPQVLGGTIHLTHQFDIAATSPQYAPVTIQSSGESGLLQPLFFNASCTQLAGLVANYTYSVLAASPGGASPVRLVVVDIDTETTTFTSEHASVSIASSSAETGLPAYVLPPVEYVPISGASIQRFKYYSNDPIDYSLTKVETKTSVEYSAVDWDGDDLKICMCEVIGQRRRVETRTGGGYYHRYYTTGAMAQYVHPDFGASTHIGYGPVFDPEVGQFVDQSDTVVNSKAEPDGPTIKIYDRRYFASTGETYLYGSTAINEYVSSEYRVFLYGGTTNIVRKVSPEVLTYHYEFSSTSFSRSSSVGTQILKVTNQFADPDGRWYTAVAVGTLEQAGALPNTSTSSGGGSSLESIETPVYWWASVEGGDLRHGCVSITEFAELGAAFKTVEYSQAGDPTLTSESKGRGAYGVQRVFVGATEILSTAASHCLNQNLQHSGFVKGASWPSGEINISLPGYSPMPIKELMPSSPFAALDWMSGPHPLAAMGAVYADQCAFSPDGKVALFVVGSCFSQKHMPPTHAAARSEAHHVVIWRDVPNNVNTVLYEHLPDAAVTPSATQVGATVTITPPPRMDLYGAVFINHVPVP